MENRGYRGGSRRTWRPRGGGGDERHDNPRFRQGDRRIGDKRGRPMYVPVGASSSGVRSDQQIVSSDQSGTHSGPSSQATDVSQLAENLGSKKQEVDSQLPKNSQGQNGNRVPIKRPDDGGRIRKNQRTLQVNHFLVKFDCDIVIRQYDVQIKRMNQSEANASSNVSKCDALLVKNEYLRLQSPALGMSATAYDGEKNVYSAIQLPEGDFVYEVSRGKDDKPQAYLFTIKLVKKLELRILQDYLQSSNGTFPLPRDILQGLDVIFKENPRRCRRQFGKSFYSKAIEENCELSKAIVASRGLQQSLKPTCQGLTLCVDYCVNTFCRKISVLQFLEDQGIHINWTKPLTQSSRKIIEKALKNLKVTVTHRITNQKYPVVALRKQSAKTEKFLIDDPNVPSGKKEMGIIEYYKSKYRKDIKHVNLPCLDLSRNNRSNYVPMEFCELVEAQKYLKEDLIPDQQKKLRNLAIAKPQERKDHICRLVKANDGPCGRDIFLRFKVDVDRFMTEATGRVIGQPDLKIRDNRNNEIQLTPNDRCQWNFLKKKVLEGKRVDRWGILDFSSQCRDGGEPLKVDKFIKSLVERCRSLGIHLSNTPYRKKSNMAVLDNSSDLHTILKTICSETEEKLQILLCPMTDRHPGYKILKLICETEIGIVTQCCRSSVANRLGDQYLANLALKINMKVGGTNVELLRRLPGLHDNHHFMFIGADVNHPTGQDQEGPSIAAVAATINWPAANKYAARFRLQKNRTERIEELGKMCLELIETYARMNKVKPEKIILFRDGVSESQFDMVLNQELTDIKKTISSEGYSPTITLVVAQKRHQTRFFLGNGNVEPGTVVDQKIVHPFEFDFYLCSHYGSLGTSKPTHYHVLWDEHSFTSDALQELIYHMCYTFARCTKPVSLVPPVYYADIVAYRGRLYYEAWAQSNYSPASTGLFSSPSSSSSATSGFPSHVSFDANAFPKLHSELENCMFFC
ncbi:hypothetical protein H6P81_019662 [Aristolochia fimbriata]|uniref:Argonaute 2 n=1 Tax=Aristolochia fimbriata TaxID=158543 RepID=A0AAV7DW79_ARIFI|nr:hypothetical protein H6P81_019662 [Aristolochia fimbriata]